MTTDTLHPLAIAPQRPSAATRLLAAWARLPRHDRIVARVGAVSAAALLVAMAFTCQASVERGERFRAEQQEQARQAATVMIRTAAASAIGLAAF